MFPVPELIVEGIIQSNSKIAAASLLLSYLSQDIRHWQK